MAGSSVLTGREGAVEVVVVAALPSEQGSWSAGAGGLAGEESEAVRVRSVVLGLRETRENRGGLERRRQVRLKNGAWL